MPGPYDLSTDQLANLLADEPAFRALPWWPRDGLYRPGRCCWPSRDGPHAAPCAQRLAVEPALHPALTCCRPSIRWPKAGRPSKWGGRSHDGAVIETVLMHYPDRGTVLRSLTQAGCAMAWQLCATGQAGFTRRPSPDDGRDRGASGGGRDHRSHAPRRRRATWSFMGMGEPLANYGLGLGRHERRLHDDLGFSARHITISTVRPGTRASDGWPRAAAGQPGRVVARRQRHAAQPTGPHQPPLALAALVAACHEYRGAEEAAACLSEVGS